MKTLFTGPFGDQAGKAYIDEAVRLIRHGKEDTFLWILPTSALLKRAREEILHKSGGYAQLPLLTFDEIAQKVIEQQWGRAYIFSRYERMRFYEQIFERMQGNALLAELEEMLAYNGGKRSLMYMLDELKRSGFTVQQAKRVLHQPTGEERIRALAALYLETEKVWERRLFDAQTKSVLLGEQGFTPETRLEWAGRILLEKGKEALPPSLSGVQTLWVEHFTDFQPLQYAILEQLVQLEEMKTVNIHLPYQEEVYADLPHLRPLVQETIQRLQGLGFAIRNTDGVSSVLSSRHEQNEQDHQSVRCENQGATIDQRTPQLLLRNVAGKLLSSTNHAVSGNMHIEREVGEQISEQIAIMPCSSPKREVEMVAKEIKRRLLADKHLNLGQIAVIARNIQDYEHDLREVFSAESLPLALDQKQAVLDTPLVKQLFAFMKLKSSRWHRDDLWKLAEGAYISWRQGPPPGLGRWMKAKGIVAGQASWQGAVEQDLQLWKEKWEVQLVEEYSSDEAFRSAQERGQNEQEQLLRIQRWFTEVADRLSTLPDQAEMQVYIQTIHALLQSFGLEAALFQFSQKHDQYTLSYFKRDMECVQRVYQSLKHLQQVTEHVQEQQRVVHFSTFIREWQEVLQGETVKICTADPGGIACLQPSAARGLSFKEVFVLGCNEGTFPQTHRENWLADDGQRLVLQQSGTLAASHYHNEMEHIFMWMTLSLPTERITFTYVSPDVEEQAIRSDLLERILKKMPARWWEKQEEHRQGRWRDALSKRAFAADVRHLSSPQEYRLWLWHQASQPVRHHADLETDAGHSAIYSLPSFAPDRSAERVAWFSDSEFRRVLQGVEAEHERQFGPFSVWDGHLGEEEVRQQLQAQFHPDYPLSISQINEYMSSPLTFFFRRVLGIRPEEETDLEVSPLAKGHLLHESLRKFYDQYRGQAFTAQEIHRYQRELGEMFADIARAYAQGTIYEHSALWELESRRLQQELQEWLRQEVTADKAGNLKPSYVEWSFGLPFTEKDEVDQASEQDPVRLPLAGETLRLYGKIDRIDIDEFGNFLIYDYKLSTAKYTHYKKLADDTLSYQVPLYLAAVKQWLQERGYADPSMVGGTFYSLRQKDDFQKVGMWDKKKTAMAGLSPRARKGVFEDIEAQVKHDLSEVAEALTRLRAGQFHLTTRYKPNPYYADNALYRYDEIQMRRKEQHQQDKEGCS